MEPLLHNQRQHVVLHITPHLYGTAASTRVGRAHGGKNKTQVVLVGGKQLEQCSSELHVDDAPQCSLSEPAKINTTCCD
jgi:hypothetical protein